MNLTVCINGKSVEVPIGTTVAVALLTAGQSAFRRSISGEPRGPLCGMGICQECRVSIDDIPHCRSCQIVCRNGMKVTTT
jgi:D-hydroxyproline dehydrogenase subunit gamma